MEFSKEQIKENKTWRELGLTDQEYQMIVEQIGKEPNWNELGMFSVLWSEHCSYKHSRALFHLFPTKGEHVVEGPGENAGAVDIGDNQAIVFKTESHNHPSAIEPYQGAATGLGGMLRDIFTMGARPIAALNSLRFGPLTDEHVRFIFKGVIEGIKGYGSVVDVPTVGGDIYFDPSYRGNPLVNVMAAGIVDKNKIARAHAGSAGHSVIIMGARTGRDGIHGASFASTEFADEGEDQTSSVAIGDPDTGKRLIEATLELIHSGIVVGIQDMGAAGLTSSSSEMAAKAGCGIEMDILKVPRREENMTTYEIMLSESQERMLVVPQKDKEKQAIDICQKWGIEATVVGKVTDDGMLRLLEGNKVVAEVPAKSLTTDGAPCYEPQKRKPTYIESLKAENPPEVVSSNFAEELLQVLKSPTVASKEWAYKQLASDKEHVIQSSGEGDAAIIKTDKKNKGIALSIGCNSRYCYLNPYRGAQIAVAEVARNISCVGGKPLAITDGMNFGSPENPEVFWQFDQAVRGISEACRVLATPVTGGNCSFYNETSGQAINPTPIIGMVGLLEDVSKRSGMGWRQEGDVIMLLGENRDELGGSEYMALKGWVGGDVPRLDLKLERAVSDVCRQLVNEGIAHSAHDCSEGGLAACLAESCITSDIGAKISVSAPFRADALLFGETQSRIVISISPQDQHKVEECAKSANIPVSVLGTTGGRSLEINLENTPKALDTPLDISLSELKRAWKDAIRDIMT